MSYTQFVGSRIRGWVACDVTCRCTYMYTYIIIMSCATTYDAVCHHDFTMSCYHMYSHENKHPTQKSGLELRTWRLRLIEIAVVVLVLLLLLLLLVLPCVTIITVDACLLLLWRGFWSSRTPTLVLWIMCVHVYTRAWLQRGHVYNIMIVIITPIIVIWHYCDSSTCTSTDITWAAHHINNNNIVQHQCHNYDVMIMTL